MRPRSLLAAVFLLSSCRLLTSDDREAADLRGRWTYTGTQATPQLELSGELLITSQTGSQVEGTATWEERDPIGNVQLAAGNVFGRAIGFTDVDFDIVGETSDRRHVARLVADTMVGIWVEGVGGATGEFRAVRVER